MSANLLKDLQKLDDFLLSSAVSEEAMLLSELDGFLTGVAVCPEPILPSEWMPVVWADEDPIYESPEQAEAINGLLMMHFNSIIRRLDQTLYGPITDIDTDDSVLLETWLAGFQTAVRLRPEAWVAFDELHKDDERVQMALSILISLSELAKNDTADSISKGLRDVAPEAISGCVGVLYQAQSPGRRAAPVVSGPKIGRNDPCPCGSGKKYKKCCLN